jgi:hypothetical protein
LLWRGEIYYVDLGQPVGREPAFRRPAVVVSVDILNNSPGGLVVVVPITTTGYGFEAMSNWSAGAVHWTTTPRMLAAINYEWFLSNDCRLAKERLDQPRYKRLTKRCGLFSTCDGPPAAARQAGGKLNPLGDNRNGVLCR